MKLDKDLEDREKKLLGKPLTGSKQCGYLYQKKEAESSTAEWPKGNRRQRASEKSNDS